MTHHLTVCSLATLAPPPAHAQGNKGLALAKLSLLEYDSATCGDDWSSGEKRQFIVAFMLHCAWFVLMLFHIDHLDGKAHLPGTFFWIRQGIMVVGLLLLFAMAGLAAAATGINPAHTRNLCHLALFACVPVTMFLFPYSCTTSSETRRAILWTAWTSIIPFYPLIKPVRRKFTIFLLAFRAFDRADDRPNTLEWLFLHTLAGVGAVSGTMLLLASSVPSSPGAARPVRLMLAVIPVIVNGFGDSLARPIGAKFGRHTFRARALWYNSRCCSGQFTRSLEGSACVLVSGALAVGTFRLFYTTIQFAVAMGAIPLALTLVEAVSPKAWDGPLILAAGGAIVVLIECLLPGCGAECPNRFSLFGIPYFPVGK